MERETGIEPATNSLEGCDSTTELLPRSGAQSYSSATILKMKNPAKVAGRVCEEVLRDELRPACGGSLRSPDRPVRHRRIRRCQVPGKKIRSSNSGPGASPVLRFQEDSITNRYLRLAATEIDVKFSRVVNVAVAGEAKCAELHYEIMSGGARGGPTGVYGKGCGSSANFPEEGCLGRKAAAGAAYGMLGRRNRQVIGAECTGYCGDLVDDGGGENESGAVDAPPL